MHALNQMEYAAMVPVEKRRVIVRGKRTEVRYPWFPFYVFVGLPHPDGVGVSVYFADARVPLPGNQAGRFRLVETALSLSGDALWIDGIIPDPALSVHSFSANDFHF